MYLASADVLIAASRIGTLPALEISLRCPALGSTGRVPAATGAQAGRGSLESTRDCIPRLGPGAPLSPSAMPPHHYGATAPRRPVVLLLSIGCTAVVLLVL